MAIFEVIAAAAVVSLAAGSEAYLYRGARFDSDGLTKESLKHLVDLGLVCEVKTAPTPEEPVEPADDKDKAPAAKGRAASK